MRKKKKTRIKSRLSLAATILVPISIYDPALEFTVVAVAVEAARIPMVLLQLQHSQTYLHDESVLPKRDAPFLVERFSDA
jgi:hypothetical protein